MFYRSNLHMNTNFEEEFNLPLYDRSVQLFDRSESCFTLTADTSSSVTAARRIGVCGACQGLDALGRSALFVRRSPADDSAPCPTLETRGRNCCSRSQSACTLGSYKKVKSQKSSTRAIYNFHVGLLTHRESNKQHAQTCGVMGAVSAPQSSSQAHDDVWDLLLH
jgi:hypothetical protein